MNPALVARLTGIQSALMAQHQGGIGLPNAVIGNERETFLREFLRRVFPSHFRFTSGAITDFRGGLTGQVDIGIEYPFLPSFPMPGSDDRLLLAESVMTVVEVKSNLVSQWQQVTETVRRVKELDRELNPLMQIGAPASRKIPCIAVGYTGYATNEGLRERLQTTPEHSRPDAALVIESGCFEGFGISAHGALGLYALCSCITQVAGRLQAAAPNMLAYVIPPEA